VIASLVLSVLALASSAPDSAGVAHPSPATDVVLSAPPGFAASGAEIVATAADSTLRLPGSAFRLGWSQERVATLGSFHELSASARTVTREGDCRWFGAPGRATLTFRHNRLSSVRLVLESAAPHIMNYAQDELRRAGYRCVARTVSGNGEDSEWLGRAHAKLGIGATTLSCEFEPYVAPAPPPAAPAIAPLDTIDFLAPEVANRLAAPMRVFTPAPPARPAAAIEAGVYGRVLVKALVDTSGAVIDASPLRGSAMLEASAIAWAKAVRFAPYREHDRAVRFWIGVPVLFVPGDTASRP